MATSVPITRINWLLKYLINSNLLTYAKNQKSHRKCPVMICNLYAEREFSAVRCIGFGTN